MINLNKVEREIEGKKLSVSYGEVYEISSNIIKSKGPICKIGDLCFIGKDKIPCEVISLKRSDVFLMPLKQIDKIIIGDKVYSKENVIELPNPEVLLGRTMNGLGQFIDGKYSQFERQKKPVSLTNEPPESMTRKEIQDVMPSGIKVIDLMLTLGEGQRMGIFAGTGVGKSTLLGMLARNMEAEVNVIALIGERSREVKQFIHQNLGEEGMKKSVLIVSTAGEQPLMLIKATQLATSIAEQFRDQGKKVLLMMDSVTRFAKARMEIDIATEQIEISGKTPSVEPYMRTLLERTGMGEKGSITGLYTVLVDGDDMNSAIPDIARGVLDGHIILDRSIAAMGRYPSIDVMKSKSRVMQDIVTKEHQKIVDQVMKYYEMYLKNEDAITIGAVDLEKNKELAKAVKVYEKINDFFKQGVKEKFEFEEVLKAAKELF